MSPSYLVIFRRKTSPIRRTRNPNLPRYLPTTAAANDLLLVDEADRGQYGARGNQRNHDAFPETPPNRSPGRRRESRSFALRWSSYILSLCSRNFFYTLSGSDTRLFRSLWFFTLPANVYFLLSYIHPACNGRDIWILLTFWGERWEFSSSLDFFISLGKAAS